MNVLDHAHEDVRLLGDNRSLPPDVVSIHPPPHQAAHDRALRRAWDNGRPPRTLPEFLRWFLAEWAAEVPERIHASGVWRDYGLHSVGGSRLGSPRDDDAFRRYLYDPPWASDALPGEDERNAVFIRPVHNALGRMARSGTVETRDNARLLFAIATSGGDWHGVLSDGSWRTPRCPTLAFQKVIATAVLAEFWRQYERQPAARSA